MLPRLHAIFHRQIPGDESLLALAQARFAQAGLLPEFYPGSPEILASELKYHPQAGMPCMVHLPRNLRVLDPSSREAIVGYAHRFARFAGGLVVHDQPETASAFEDYLAAVRDLDAALQGTGPGPLVFIEYAAGVPTDVYASLFEAVRTCPRVSSCIDISHIGIRQCQRAFDAIHPGEEVCHLKWNTPGLKDRIDDVQAACETALPVVCDTVRRIGRLGKPLHFHLHDGHPASTFSAYGVSDHLSFFRTIPLPFTHRGARSLPLLFGPMGLKSILDTARSQLPDHRLTLTLEVHAPEGRLDLGDQAYLFRHWKDPHNAERMNHWIEELIRCQRLVQQACR